MRDPGREARSRDGQEAGGAGASRPPQGAVPGGRDGDDLREGGRRQPGLLRASRPFPAPGRVARASRPRDPRAHPAPGHRGAADQAVAREGRDPAARHRRRHPVVGAVRARRGHGRSPPLRPRHQPRAPEHRKRRDGGLRHRRAARFPADPGEPEGDGGTPPPSSRPHQAGARRAFGRCRSDGPIERRRGHDHVHAPPGRARIGHPRGPARPSRVSGAPLHRRQHQHPLDPGGVPFRRRDPGAADRAGPAVGGRRGAAALPAR